ncbi:MAG TPA: alpha/beta hydrolase [Acidimicrobiales bacterium]|nr:alpha/beta hydrolase [Acidimicrobiales bacterium]
MTSWLLLALSLVGLALTANAYQPPQWGFTSPLAFFPGWLVSELPVHTIVGQAVVTAVLVPLGALDHAAGWVGLALCIVSWLGLGGLVVQAGRAGGVLEAALDDGLGPAWREQRDRRLSSAGARVIDRAQLVVPFVMRDRRVEKLRNVDYWGDGRRAHRLDIYRPREDCRDAPVLVYIHGGGWVIGDKREQGLPMMLYLAAQGWVCVTINYRLSPRATWPDHLVDCKRAVAWVRENIAGYGGNPGFVAVSGGSAGGHLAAMVGLTPGLDRFQPDFEGRDTSVDACIPFYGIYDFTGTGTLRDWGFAWFIGRTVLKKKMRDHPEAFRDASPMAHIGPGAPPFMVVHGANDSLAPVAQARGFVAGLRDVCKQPVVYAELPGAQHAFEVFRSIRTAHAVAAVTDFLAWVRATRADQERPAESRAGTG